MISTGTIWRRHKKYGTAEVTIALWDYDPLDLVARLAERGRFGLVMRRRWREKMLITTRCTNPVAFSHPDPDKAPEIRSFEPVDICPFCGHPDYLEVIRNGKA